MYNVIEKLKDEEKIILEKVSDPEILSESTHNIRLNGKLFSKKINDNVNIESKDDAEGINIFVKENSKKEIVFIPVIVSEGGISDKVYNDFYIGENAEVTIYAGCGIFNCTNNEAEHSGIHRFYLGKNSKVKYTENHYGHGSGSKVLNPVTEIYLEEGSSLEMKTTQIEGVNSTIRTTNGVLKKDSTLTVRENIKTHHNQYAKTIFNVDLSEENSSCHLISRAVATDDSVQEFYSTLTGNDKCYAHSECDAILDGNAKATAKPIVIANNPDARLIHEATIGKIAGKQLQKLMTLGKTEKEAAEIIINGFLK